MPPTVWTDLDLVAEARSALTDAGVSLEVHAEGDTAGLDTAEAIIAGSRLVADATLFARTARLRVLARSGIGYDRIDLAAASAARIVVVNTPEAPTESTAEFALALLLAAARRLPAAAGALGAGRWLQGPSVVGADLQAKCLGLIGCGRIGRRVAELAQAFGMHVLAFDPLQPTLPPEVRRAASLAELFAQADAISLHVPATPDTRHLLDASAFARMRPGVIVVNTARGPLIDTVALLAALESGRVSAAAIDVWDPEPPSPNEPLLMHPAVIATPHMAALTREGRRRSHLAATRQVMQVLGDERPEHLLNAEIWPHRRARGEVC
jgi:phosphoglycerate dehydrogenase-like enzyme